MAVVGARKWAVILCEFKASSGSPVTVDFCRKFPVLPRPGQELHRPPLSPYLETP